MNEIKKYKFCDLYDIASGISSTKGQAGHGAPFLSFGTVFNNYFLPENLIDKMDTTIEEQNTFSIKKGDVFVTRTSETIDELAMSSVALKDYPNATYSGFVKRLRPKTTGIVYDKFLAFYLRSKLFRKTMTNNATMTLRASFNEDIFSFLYLYLPPYEEQKKIGDLLYNIEMKMLANKKINDNLEQQAAALFESWFVNYDPWDGVQPSEWENAPLGSFVEIKRGGSPRPIQDFLSDSGLRWLKISDVTSLSSPFVLEIKEHIKEEGLRKTVFLHAGELVLSNSATPGIPKILDVDTCIHDGWLYFPKSELSKYYLYLFFKHIRKELVALGNGSVFTNLKTDILKAFPATKADEATLKEFDALVTPLFDAMLNADRENFKLAAMRDALLPKLMSSEIDVSEVEL